MYTYYCMSTTVIATASTGVGNQIVNIGYYQFVVRTTVTIQPDSILFEPGNNKFQIIYLPYF